LMILAFASMFAGLVPFHDLITSDGTPLHTEFHLMVAVPSVLIALIGISLAYVMYFRKNTKPESVANSLQGVYTTIFRKFYIDEIYLFVTHKLIFNLISHPVAWFDRNIVDGSMNLIGNTTVYCSGAIKKMQSGQLQTYIWFFTSGVLVLALLVLYFN
jgi:NADH-quinone oxidoreductase subunit L